MKSYARFYTKFLERLHRAEPFGSRAEAEAWMRDAWTAIHVEAGASKRRIRILRSARICAEQGWKDIDKEVCYLTSPEYPPIRLYVHSDGTVVLQQMGIEHSEILLAKRGKKVPSLA